jgi:hypothetical protein
MMMMMIITNRYLIMNLKEGRYIQPIIPLRMSCGNDLLCKKNLSSFRNKIFLTSDGRYIGVSLFNDPTWRHGK